jgi:hypothetical protein
MPAIPSKYYSNGTDKTYTAAVYSCFRYESYLSVFFSGQAEKFCVHFTSYQPHRFVCRVSLVVFEVIILKYKTMNTRTDIRYCVGLTNPCVCRQGNR